MPYESIKIHVSSNNSLAPALNHISTKLRIKFDGSCLKQEKVTFTHKKVVNIYIAHEINLCSCNVVKDFPLGNSLFGAVKLTKYADSDKYKHSGYGAGFELIGAY